MEDEFMKHCTDCVYFLASPFTCKKGVDCEYRHSDAARLNPRDCWYWLYGTCSNLRCRFRHPPLDVHDEGSTEVAGLPNPPSVPVRKTTVPCYYYYSGCCNKDDLCPFLHEPGDTFTWNSKVGNSVTDATMPPSSSKASERSDIRKPCAEKLSKLSETKMISGNGFQVKQRQPAQQASIEIAQNQNTSVEPYVPSSRKASERIDTGKPCAGKHSKLPETKMISGNGFQVKQRQPAQRASIEIAQNRIASIEPYVPERKENADVETVSLLPSEDLYESECEPSLGSEQSSEELIDGNVVRYEWWESSPGFDVLVEEQTHGMAYEDDLEYLHHRTESDTDHDPLFVQYGLETDSDERVFLNNRLYDPSEHLDNNEFIANYGSFSPRHVQNRKVRQSDSHKRKFCYVESPMGGYNDVDLRDHLRRKRMVDCHLDGHDLRHDLVQRRLDKPEMFVRPRPNPCLHGRLASRAERNGVWIDRRTSVTGTNRRGRLRILQHNNFRNYNGLSGRYNPAKRQPRSYLKSEKYGPKLNTVTKLSMVEIEENKRRGYRGKNTQVDFEGPKPLSEILKEKKKTIFCEDGTVTGCF